MGNSLPTQPSWWAANYPPYANQSAIHLSLPCRPIPERAAGRPASRARCGLQGRNPQSRQGAIEAKRIAPHGRRQARRHVCHSAGCAALRPRPTHHCRENKVVGRTSVRRGAERKRLRRTEVRPTQTAYFRTSDPAHCLDPTPRYFYSLPCKSTL